MLEQLIGKLGSVLPSINALRKENRELADNALRAVSHALNETHIYYKSIDKGRPRNEEIENQLVKYWAAAAIPMRHIDTDFAAICEYKSQYWLNPDTWTEKQIKEFGIGLEHVREQYRTRLVRGKLIKFSKD